MKLQLSFLLDASIDKHVAYKIMILVGKKLLQPYVLLVKKLSKLDKKVRRKTRKILINEKTPKLNKKTRKKINHLLLCILFCKGWKTSKI